MAFKKALFYLGGTLRIRVYGATVERFLNLCARHNIVLRQMRRMDYGELRATVSVRDFRRLRRHMGRTGCRVQVLYRRGAPFVLHRLQGRYVLAAGLVTVFFLAYVLTQYLWGIRIMVPHGVSEAEVLQNLQSMGVHTGARISSLDFDAVQLGLQSRMKQLSFVSLEMHGGRIDVRVYVRTPKPSMIDESLPTSVVATQTGVLTKLNVYQGTAMKKVGDLVQKGEVLASALVLPTTEQGQARLVHAEAEAEARTWYTVTSRRVITGKVKRYTGETKTQYALVFGKKRVNLYFGCGISDRDCDKIVREYHMTFADHFEVPVGLVRQTSRFFTLEPAQQQQSAQEMEQAALARLRGEINGTVSTFHSTYRQIAGGAELTLRAECREQIGQEVLDTQKLPAPKEGEQKHDGTDTAD